MRKAYLAFALSILTFACVAWAVPQGIAHQHVRATQSDPVLPIRFRDERERGLLVDAWVNGAGPFVFAVDTGSGVTIVTQRVVQTAGLRTSRGRRPLVGGLSTAPISSNEETRLQPLALGDRDNKLSNALVAAVVNQLPGSLDGILDPTTAFSPLGYSVDLPKRELVVFDPRTRGVRVTDTPRDGAVVRWIQEDASNKPFVKLGDGRLALIDTGSGFGLAFNGGDLNQHQRNRTARDIGGGMVQSREVAPTTVMIGSLELRKVPTNVLFGAAPDIPVILGRRALYPFKITFDPMSRLIAFEPTQPNVR